MFGSSPEQLRSLAAWLLEQEAEEVVMESTAPILETSVGSAGKGIGSRYARSEKAQAGGRETLHLGAGAIETAGPRGRKKDFPDAERLVKRLVARETDSELCARLPSSVCGGRFTRPKVPVDAQPSAAAEPTGVFSGRGPH